MALTPSNMLPLHSEAPHFELPDTVSGDMVSDHDIQGDNGMLVMFICNHCPYVIHVEEQMTSVAKYAQDNGLGVVAISSNDVINYPDDDPVKMKTFAERLEFTFPYLYDESQDVAKAYDAACTPDFYLFDSDKRLVYRGRLDDSRPGNGVPLTGSDMRLAIRNLVEGRPQEEKQYPSMGCNIKWRD